MMILEQFRISDFLEWHENKMLVLNPAFQRRNVWSPTARVYLIDTILRRMPMPKVYIRTRVDLSSKKSYREVIDGQQRLRAIIDFSKDEFLLTKRAREFQGLRYSQLDQELQEVFLSYPIAVGQLVNASDEDVLEIFARLNSYTVVLNDPEKRHARFQSSFKWAVYESARAQGKFWDNYGILTLKQRSRMQDDSLTAELYSVLLRGVTDGGEGNITKLYELYERHEDQFSSVEMEVTERFNRVIESIDHLLGDVLVGSVIATRPHFVMLFASVAHALFGIPLGQLDGMPERNPLALSSPETTQANLAILGDVIASGEIPKEPYDDLQAFWTASISNPHRISRRKIRFPVFYRALLPYPL